MAVDTVEVGIVKIEEDARYLIVVEHDFPIRSEEEARRVREHVSGTLRSWWDSGEKFVTLVTGEGVRLRLERIGRVEEDAETICQK